MGGIPESKASSKKTDEDQKKKKNDDDDAKANATIESFSTETKVILTTLGKILERLEALELVALRNAKEVARVESALHGFIVGQARKENGKEPITSANLFAVVDSSEEEEEEEEEEEKIEEEIKENIVLRAGRLIRERRERRSSASASSSSSAREKRVSLGRVRRPLPGHQPSSS